MSVSRHGQVVLIGAVLALGLGARVHAQTQLIDPKDAPKIFSSACSACHKSPAGLAKSGQVAGFLRQHYTTGPEMSAAMAAYLAAAGSGPAAKKGEAKAREQNENPATKGKLKKSEHAAVQPGDRTGEPRPEPRPEARPEAKSDAKNAKDHRTLRGRHPQQAKAHEERPAAPPSPPPAAEASHPAPAAASAAESPAQTASVQAAAVPAAPAAPAAAAEPAAPAAPPMVTLDIPLPEMPTAPPADLTQSVFSSSPVP